MFSVKLYRFYCEKNKIDKTEYMQLITTLYGNLREATSITNISIVVSLDIDLLKNIKADVLYDDNGSLVAINDAIVKYDNEFGFNYLYIDEFKRYYFINDLIAAQGNLWQIDASCDVLMSFKENIYNPVCFSPLFTIIINPFRGDVFNSDGCLLCILCCDKVQMLSIEIKSCDNF